MAPKVGEKEVVLKVGEKAASHLTPLYTRLVLGETVDQVLMNLTPF